MQVDAVHVNVSQERQGGSRGSRSEKGKSSKGGRSKSKKGGKDKEDKAASKFNGECRYCQKKGHRSGLTSCPINYADDLPLLPRPSNLPSLSNAARGQRGMYWLKTSRVSA